MNAAKQLRSWLAVTTIIVGLLVWLVASPAMAAQPIPIGVIAPKGHIIGDAVFNAAELAVDQINSQGGVNGRKLVLHQYDSRLSASNASRAFQRAVRRDGVVAVAGASVSEVALALMPWAARLQTPLIVTGAATSAIPERIHAQPKRFQYVFHGFINTHVLATETCTILHDLLARNPRLQGFNRAAIFSEDAAWTKPLDATFEKCLPKAGLKIVYRTRFALGTVDFTPIYSAIERAKANVIVAGLAHVGVKPVVQWHQQQVPALLLGNNGQAGSSKFWSATHGATQDVATWNVAAHGAPMTAKTAAFFKAYTKRFHVKEPAYDAYTTYDDIYALADALRRTNGAGGKALVKSLEKTDMVGVLGRVAFHGLSDTYAHEVIANADPAKGQSFLAIQWQDGKQVVIWPKRLATGQLQIPSFVPMPE